MKQSRNEKSNVVSGRSSTDNRGTDLGLSSPCERAEASLPALGMHEVKHTPGPWYLGESKAGPKYVYSVGSDSPVEPKVRIPKKGDPQKEANARLMAAAPELLDALITLHTYIDFDEAMTDGTDFRFDNVSGINAAFRKAYAVIRKAEGR